MSNLTLWRWTATNTSLATTPMPPPLGLDDLVRARGGNGARKRRNKSGDQMDLERREAVAVQYLCRLAEARDWMQACLGGQAHVGAGDRPRCRGHPNRRRHLAVDEDDDGEESDDEESVLMAAGAGGFGLVQFEEGLRNGVALAKLASLFAPELVPPERIFDADLARYEECGLGYRHTDNVNGFIGAVRALGLPEIFTPETSDVYARKNMPKLVYCLHALAIFLNKLGKAPPIGLVADGNVPDFSEGEVSLLCV